MKNELREKGRGAGRAADGRSHHAVLWCLAGRGGDSAEQSNQIMSGVCGHWVRSFQAFHRPRPAFGAGFRRVRRSLHQPAPAELPQGRTVSGRRENRLRAGAELLLLPGSLRSLPHWGVSGGSGVFQVQLLRSDGTGFLILLGVLLGRFICGFLCPFGWFQELLA